MKRGVMLATMVALTGCDRVATRQAVLSTVSAGAASRAVRDVAAVDASGPDERSGPRCATQLALLHERPGSIATVTADTTGPVVATCAALQRDSQRSLGALQRRARDVDVSELGPIGRCLAAGRGAWFIAPVRTRARLVPRYTDRTERGWEVHVSWRADYVDAQGRRHEGTVGGEVFHTDPSDEQLTIILQYDGDSDGVAELILGTHATNFEGGDALSAMPIAWSNGRASLDPRMEGIDVTRPVDPDGDGRVDFVQPSAFESASMTMDGPRTEEGPATLVHRRADGAFSRDDAVAKAFVLAQCFDGDDSLSLDGGDDQLLVRVVCDRMFGANPAAITQRLEALEAEGNGVPSGELRRRLLHEPLPFAFDRCVP